MVSSQMSHCFNESLFCQFPLLFGPQPPLFSSISLSLSCFAALWPDVWSQTLWRFSSAFALSVLPLIGAYESYGEEGASHQQVWSRANGAAHALRRSHTCHAPRTPSERWEEKLGGKLKLTRVWKFLKLCEAERERCCTPLHLCFTAVRWW